MSEDLKEMREASDRLLEAEQALGIQRDRAADTASATTIKTVSTALVAAKGATAVAGARGATSPFMTGAGSEIAKAASVAKGLFKKMPGLGRAGSAYGSFKTSLADAAAGNGIVGTLRGLGGKCGNAAKWFDRTGWAAGVTRAAPWYLKPLGWALHAGTWAAKWATLPVWVFPAAAGKIVLPVVASSIKQAAWLGSRAGLPIAEFGANASIKGAKYSPAAVYMEGASAAADSLHETNVLDSDVVLLAQIEPDRWGQIYADHEKKVRALQEKFQTGKIGQEEYSRRYDALALEWKQNFREFIGNFEAAGITQRNLVDAASTLSTAEWNQLQADFYGIYRIEEELKKREAQEEAREKWVALLAERRESVTGTE